MLSAVGKVLIQSGLLCCILLSLSGQGMQAPQSKSQFSQTIAADPFLPQQRPAAKGLNEQVLHQLVQQIQNKAKPGYQQVHSLLLYKSGALVLEFYQSGNHDFINFEQGVKRVKGPQHFNWTADEPHYVASVTKAVTATLTGIALEQTGLTLDTRLGQLLPNHPAIQADL